jgi:hypothetical protein
MSSDKGGDLFQEAGGYNHCISHGALCDELEGLGKSLVRSEMLLRWRILTFRMEKEVGDGVTRPGSSEDRQQERMSYE